MGALAIRPNVVVGVFGAVVFLLTGTIIVQNWRTLTDTNDYDVRVQNQTTALGQRSSTVGSGATRAESYHVTLANITSVSARLTWQESSITGAQHDVTATLRDARNTVVAKATGQGGVAGIALQAQIGDTPAGGRFTTRGDNARDAFESEYPPHPETIGDWTLTIQTNTPSQPGASGITYTLTLEAEHYTATFEKAVPLQK